MPQFFFIIPDLLCVNSLTLHKKELHLFLITSGGNLGHLNCRSQFRVFGSDSLEAVSARVPLPLLKPLFRHPDLNSQNCCELLLFYQSNKHQVRNKTIQCDSAEHAQLCLGTCFILAKDTKKGKNVFVVLTLKPLHSLIPARYILSICFILLTKKK